MERRKEGVEKKYRGHKKKHFLRLHLLDFLLPFFVLLSLLLVLCPPLPAHSCPGPVEGLKF